MGFGDEAEEVEAPSLDVERIKRTVDRSFLNEFGITDDDFNYFVDKFFEEFPTQESTEIYAMNQGLSHDGGGVINGFKIMDLPSRNLWCQVNMVTDMSNLVGFKSYTFHVFLNHIV